MNKGLLPWLLSLSVLSLLGPKGDVDYLSSRGFYKKKDKEELELKLNISKEVEGFKKFNLEIQSFLDIMGVSDRESFHNKVNELINVSLFANNMDKIMQLGRIMPLDSRNNKKSILVNNHPYTQEMFREVLYNEFRWPRQGLLSYDVANGIMLLRLGIGMGYLTDEEQMNYLVQFKDKYKDYFTSYQKFGEECIIGRNLQVFHLKNTRSTPVLEEQEQLLSIAYYGIWQYLNTGKRLGGLE